MNPVKMPGFTAASSLRHGDKRYAAPGAVSEKSHSAIRPQLRVGGGGVSNSNGCVDRWQNCYIDCSVKDTNYREGCFDSCDAAFNLCRSMRGATSNRYRW